MEPLLFFYTVFVGIFWVCVCYRSFKDGYNKGFKSGIEHEKLLHPNPSTEPEYYFHCKHCSRQLIGTRGQRGMKCISCNIYYIRGEGDKIIEVDDEELAGGNKAGGII